MKKNIISFLISISFVLTNLQIFLPFFSEKVSFFGLLVINLILLLVVNILQERPSIVDLESDSTILEEFHIRAYLISTVWCCLAEFVLIVGCLAFGWQREHIYDLIILLIISFILLISGREVIKEWIGI